MKNEDKYVYYKIFVEFKISISINFSNHFIVNITIEMQGINTTTAIMNIFETSTFLSTAWKESSLKSYQ